MYVGAYSTKLDAAKDAVVRQIRGLRRSCLLRLISFSDKPKLEFQGSSKDLVVVQDRLANIRAQGLTNLAAALDLALMSGFDLDSENTVFIISDGLANLEETVAVARRYRHSLRSGQRPAHIRTILIDPTPEGQAVADSVSDFVESVGSKREFDEAVDSEARILDLAVPPPDVLRLSGVSVKWVAAAILLLVGIAFFIGSRVPRAGGQAGSSQALIIPKMFVLLGCLLLVPTLTSNVRRRFGLVPSVLAEVAFVVTASAAFSFWVFGSSGIGIWIAYAAATGLLIDGGTHIIQWRLTALLDDLSAKATPFRQMEQAKTVERLVGREVLVYAALPTGVLLVL